MTSPIDNWNVDKGLFVNLPTRSLRHQFVETNGVIPDNHKHIKTIFLSDGFVWHLVGESLT